MVLLKARNQLGCSRSRSVDAAGGARDQSRMAASRAESRGNAREPGSALRGTHSSAQLSSFSLAVSTVLMPVSRRGCPAWEHV